MDASAANYRTLNRFLRHNSSSSSLELTQRVRHLDALAQMAPTLVEPLVLWRGFSSMAYVQHLKEAILLCVFVGGGEDFERGYLVVCFFGWVWKGWKMCVYVCVCVCFCLEGVFRGKGSEV